jgi:hypothetical protein
VTRVSTCPRCGASFEGPWFKRFCTAKCRTAWHTERQKKGLQLLQSVEPECLPAMPHAEELPTAASQGEAQNGMGTR